MTFNLTSVGIMADNAKLHKMAEAARSQARTDATEKIVNEILRLADI